MAEVATPSTNGGATEKKTVVKPERPDEDTYKKAVTKAEKELNDAKAKFVSNYSTMLMQSIGFDKCIDFNFLS